MPSCILKDFLAVRQETDDDFWVSFNATPATFVKYSNLESFDCQYFKATAETSTTTGDIQIVSLDEIAVFTPDNPLA